MFEMEVIMKRKGVYIVGLVMLLAASVQAIPVPSPLPLVFSQISPASPTTADTISLQLFGTWPNTCPPEELDVEVDGTSILIDMLLPDAADDCTGPEPDCDPQDTGWGATITVGPLPAGDYSVSARAVSCDEDSGFQSVGSFTVVGVPVGGGPTGLSPGDCVVLLEDGVPELPGLQAGRAGTVVCCDTEDCSGLILVSWFFYTQGIGDTLDCISGTPAAFPPNSAQWVDPATVTLGVCVNQCGTLRQGLEGCILFDADDGQTYNLFDGDWLAQAIGGMGMFDFGDRVRVVGLLNRRRPVDMVFTCPEQDGDIYAPVIQPCAPVGSEGCCDGLQPGDRVLLTVDNPIGPSGRVAILPAGTRGTVVCCDLDDPNFPIFVSWDGFTGGSDADADCDPPIFSHPPNSGLWMQCDQIAPLPGDGEPCPDEIMVGIGGTGVWLRGDAQCPDPSNTTFTGCTNVTLETNFRAQLSVKVTPAAGVGGTWEGSVTPDIVGPGTATVEVCVTVTGLDVSTLPPGKGMQVASVSIFAVPAP